MSNKKLSLAAEAYLYGYPLVECIGEMIKNTSGPATVFSGPVNMFAHATKLAGPETDIVTPNNDTLYSFLFADVTQEPLVLHLPDTDDRYYVMQFIDAWTNNFAYLGRRATGTKEGHYLLAGPSWDGDVPDGITLLRAPTNIFVVAGRFACSGEEDISNVRALQAQTWATQKSLYPNRADNSRRQFGDWKLAPYNEMVSDELRFWEQFRAWMKLFPPPEVEQLYIKKFEPLGVVASESPYVSPEPELVETLKAGKAECVAFIEANMAPGESVNGWLGLPHAFDFNLDHLGIGTLPDWKFSDRATAYFFRAILARIGLWGQHGYEAYYPQIFEDHQGQQLSGSYKYAVHFDELPPAGAFWSITMYDLPGFRLIDNPINRYSIGDRTTGLKYNDDGSLDIYIQADSPGPDKEANWLPCPRGNFRPVMRMYQPRPEALDGTYVLPPIRRELSSFQR
ncbi:MAG: DUF1254 domain-containing protein [Methanotrichaceae archaeon]|nr:DUF1254 domain-containing protein [Methanotrichaceae archaeon]